MSVRIKLQKNFPRKEILSGLDIDVTNFLSLNDTMDKLQVFRTDVNECIDIIDINRLSHDAKYGYHPKSRAVDIFIHNINKYNIDAIVEKALNAGFKGVGVYRNHIGVYSFHLDTRNSYVFWRGEKKEQYDSWTYSNLIKV